MESSDEKEKKKADRMVEGGERKGRQSTVGFAAEVRDGREAGAASRAGAKAGRDTNR